MSAVGRQNPAPLKVAACAFPSIVRVQRVVVALLVKPRLVALVALHHVERFAASVRIPKQLSVSALVAMVGAHQNPPV